ncbi:MAG: hypothetical protein B6V02_01970 [Thermoprotei archaeon ex4572_64]|nr:MAG: hypothetical protein B6V02_01970 [Thermoprotei archaeon ex4572_64]
MQIRESHSSDVLLELSTSNGRLSINGVNGTITANVDADVTAALDFETAVWDIELYPAGDESLAISPLFGEVTLRLEVTR